MVRLNKQEKPLPEKLATSISTSSSTVLWRPSVILYLIAIILFSSFLLPLTFQNSIDFFLKLTFLGAFVALLFRAPHLIVSWWMSYFNTPLKRSYGEAEYNRIFIRNGFIVFLISFLSFGSLAFVTTPVWGVFIVLLLTATNPLTFHHNYSQDRGILGLVSSPDIDSRKVTNYFLRIIVPIFFICEIVFLNNILLMKTILGYPLIDFKGPYFLILYITAIICSVSLLMFSIIKGIKAWNRHLYFSFFLGSYGSRLLSLVGSLSLGSALFESVRHNFFYTDLVTTYYNNRRNQKTNDTGNSSFEKLLVSSSTFYWTLTILFSVVFSIFSWQILAIMPDQLLEVIGLSSKFWTNFSVIFLFFSYGFTGAVIYHHFYVDRYLWKFRDIKLREEILPLLNRVR